MARILVVDDDKKTVSTIALYLRADGHSVLEAYTGSGAVEQFRTERPDLVVLDLMLPGIDGLDVALLAVAAIVVLTSLLTLVISQSLEPVRRLTLAAEQLRSGADPEPVAGGGAREVDALTNAFNGMARTIREEQTARRRLLADVSHELRGPLANLRGQIEAMQDGLLRVGPDALASLHDETMLLARLVDDLHELTLADTRSLALRREPTDPAAVIASAADPLRPAFRGAGITLRLDLPAALRTVSVDPQRIVQVLRNVLHNALHYAKGGEVVISARDAPGTVEVTIADTGGGVDESDLERIFDRLYRPDSSRARASGGSGLGLAIARAIIVAHGGEIGARANAPHGLSVWIRLPVAAQAPARS